MKTLKCECSDRNKNRTIISALYFVLYYIWCMQKCNYVTISFCILFQGFTIAAHCILIIYLYIFVHTYFDCIIIRWCRYNNVIDVLIQFKIRNVFFFGSKLTYIYFIKQTVVFGSLPVLWRRPSVLNILVWVYLFITNHSGFPSDYPLYVYYLTFWKMFSGHKTRTINKFQVITKT